MPEDEFVKAATTVVVPPPEIEKFTVIVEEAARKDPEWYEKFSKESPPGVPLPFHPKIGLTQEEYDEYRALWEKREFKVVEPLVLQLKETKEGVWVIRSVGKANPISTLRYHADKDVFISPNGTLERSEDVKADPESTLREWSGHEWQMDDETSLGTTMENVAIGQSGDGKYGMLIYRLTEVTTDGKPIYDTSFVIRFPKGKAGILPKPTPGKK